jgi:penicillin-binding protein 1A
MLEGTIERGTGVAAKALGRPAAAKTGTTNDYSNAWFIGYTPKLATGVWVGYDRPRSLGRDETGSRVAVPIWTAFMSEALAGTPGEDFPVPERVVVLPVDLDPGGGCVRPVMMAFVAGTEPQVSCGPAKSAPTPIRNDPGDQTMPRPVAPSQAGPSQPLSNQGVPSPPAAPGSAAASPSVTSPLLPPPVPSRPSRSGQQGP